MMKTNIDKCHINIPNAPEKFEDILAEIQFNFRSQIKKAGYTLSKTGAALFAIENFLADQKAD